MTDIIFEAFDGAVHATVLCAPRADWALGVEDAVEAVRGFAPPDCVVSNAFAHASVLGGPPLDWTLAAEVAVNTVLAVAPRELGYSTNIIVEPDVRYVWGISALDSVVSAGHVEFHGTVEGQAARPWVMASNATGNRVAAFASYDAVYSMTFPEYVAAFGCFMQPYAFLKGAGFDLPMAIDSGEVTDDAYTLLTIHAKDKANVVGAIYTHLQGSNSVLDIVNAIDAAAIVFQMIADSEAYASDSAEAFISQLLEAADLAVATGAASTMLTATLAVSILAEVGDKADLLLLLTADDLATVLDDAELDRVMLLAAVLDAAVGTDDASSVQTMLVVATDAGAIEDSAGTSLEALAAAFDAGEVLGHIRVGSESYAVYAMALAGAAVSEYQDIQFNSQAVINGHLYVASENGLFLAEGDDDDGAPINASVRMGPNALGTQLMKSTPEAYIGYTSDGEMLFKVSTTDKGVKRTNVYKLNPVLKSVVSDNRFSISKGLSSVYWDYEIANHEGSDFELETIKVWRLALSRRK